MSATAIPGSQERIAWLLRVNRRYGKTGRDVRLATFAADLTDAGCPVTSGQISRWESGSVPVPHRAVATYEKVLGLPHNSLVTVVDGVYRIRTARPAPSRLAREVRPDDPVSRARAEDLLDGALFGGSMSGADWDELTVLLTSFTNVVMPGRLWDALAQRLLREQLISDGDFWRQRSESTHRLLWLPVSRPHVIAASAAVVRDPASQIVVEPLAILDVVDDPAAAELLVAQLADPANERALLGALLAGATKVRHRQFNPVQLRKVTTAVLDLLTDTSWSAAVRPLAGQLLGQLPPESRAEAVRRLRATFAGDPALATAVTGGPASDDGRSRVVVNRITAWVLSRTAAYVDDTPDQLLTGVIDEMLFSASSDVRLHAAQLAGATPFRQDLADACCAELRKPAVARDPALAATLLEALPFVAGPDHRPVVEMLVTAPGLPAATASSAARSIAHLPGSSSDLFWTTALQRRRSQPGAYLRGLVYALGIAGQQAWLTRISQDVNFPAEARTAARWWSNLPASLTRDARH